jgi:hypothetical protein
MACTTSGSSKSKVESAYSSLDVVGLWELALPDAEGNWQVGVDRRNPRPGVSQRYVELSLTPLDGYDRNFSYSESPSSKTWNRFRGGEWPSSRQVCWAGVGICRGVDVTHSSGLGEANEPGDGR